MIVRLAAALSALCLAAAAHADTENVRKGQSQLEFRPVASASGGSTARPVTTYSERQGMFRHFDIDGDGFVSKAEAAGHASVTLGFDRADRNRDGKLSFAEYDSIYSPRPAKKVGRTKASASAGATRKKSD
jgi:hypothetical protein